MEQSKIIEGNKRIAKFIGIHWHENGTVSNYPSALPFKMGVSKSEDMLFHSSWDWLMFVVEKIEQDAALSIVTNNWHNGGQYQCDIYKCFDMEANLTRGRIVQSYGVSKIEVVYDAVQEFITWYNQQPK